MKMSPSHPDSTVFFLQVSKSKLLKNTLQLIIAVRNSSAQISNGGGRGAGGGT